MLSRLYNIVTRRDAKVYYSLLELVEIALNSRNLPIFKEIIHTIQSTRIDVNVRKVFFRKVANMAAEMGRVRELSTILKTNTIILNPVAASAAKGGHKEMVNELIKLGAKNYESIARSAAEGGYKDITLAMINRGAKNFNEIVYYTAKGGDIEIFNNIDTNDKDLISNIARYAAMNGHLAIVKKAFNLGATSERKVAIEAAYGGYKDIVNFIINRGFDDYKIIGYNAAEGGHKDIVMSMIVKVGRDVELYRELARIAADSGHLRLYEEMVSLFSTNEDIDAYNDARSGDIDLIDQHVVYSYILSAMAYYAAKEGHMGIVNYMIGREIGNYHHIIKVAYVNGVDFTVEKNRIIFDIPVDWDKVDYYINSDVKRSILSKMGLNY